ETEPSIPRKDVFDTSYDCGTSGCHGIGLVAFLADLMRGLDGGPKHSDWQFERPFFSEEPVLTWEKSAPIAGEQIGQRKFPALRHFLCLVPCNDYVWAEFSSPANVRRWGATDVPEGEPRQNGNRFGPYDEGVYSLNFHLHPRAID